MTVGAERRRRGLTAVLFATALGTAAAAQVAEPRGVLEPPDLVELTGHVGTPAPGETGGWNVTLGVGYSPIVYHFHLSGMRILNSGRLPLTVLSELEPYRPTFFVFGSAARMSILAAATPAQTVVLRGYRRRGSRTLMLTDVQVETGSGARAPATIE